MSGIFWCFQAHCISSNPVERSPISVLTGLELKQLWCVHYHYQWAKPPPERPEPGLCTSAFVRVYCAQISSAFKNFGVSGDDQCCLVARLADSDGDSGEMDRVCSSVCARQLPLTSVREFNAEDKIKKVGDCLGFYFCEFAQDAPCYMHLITFHVSRRRRRRCKIYILVTHVCLSVPRHIPTLLHGPGCNLEE